MNWHRREGLRLVRYGIVGSLNTVMAYGVFAGLLRAGLHFTLATLASSTFGMVVGFKLHGRFVFGHSGEGRFPRFFLLFAALYGLNLGLQGLARMAVNGYSAGAIAACVSIPVSFLVNRNFVFHHRSVDTP